MTNQIKCPNCCNGNVQTLETWSPKNECLKCYECGCNNWDESKRQPPEITPEAAYNWFCDRLLENSKDDVACLNLLGGEYLWAEDTSGSCWAVLTKNEVKALGWQGMPERWRDDNNDTK